MVASPFKGSGSAMERLDDSLDEDTKRAIQLSLNQADPGAGGGGLEEAAFKGLPQVESLEFSEQLRLAKERSERDEKLRKLKEQEEEEEAIRKAIQASMKDTRPALAKVNCNSSSSNAAAAAATSGDSPDVAAAPFDIENEEYREQFQRALRVSSAASSSNNKTSRPHGSPLAASKQVKKRMKTTIADLPPEPHPNDLRRIQEEELLVATLERSRQEHQQDQRGGGGTNLPPAVAANGLDPDLYLPPEALSEEAQLRLAIERSKGDVTPKASSSISPPPFPSLTPPAAVASAATSASASAAPSSPRTNGYSKAAKTTTFGTSCGYVDRRTIKEPPDGGLEANRKGERRPIVVDGCNVGFQFARNSGFSAQGLQIVYQYFVDRGWRNDEIVIFLKRPPLSPADQAICDQLDQMGVLAYTPKRWVGDRRIVCDDDKMVLDYAKDNGGVVVSMDQYRDAYDKFPEYRDTISKRLLQFNFVHNKIVFPRFPLGDNGPPLDDMLKF